MEFLFNILKHLSQTLTTLEFLFALATMLGISFMVVRFFLKMGGKNSIVKNFLKNDNEDALNDIIARLDRIVTHENHQQAIAKILEAIEELKVQSDEHDVSMRTQMTDILLLKKDVESLSESINKELNELRHELKMYDSQHHQMSDGMKEILQRLHGLMQRVISQIDKIDEFTRAAIPEFRSYHKELSKEVSDLNRDIALVERTINTQINTTNAINLR
jgi:chromosome segregation ATPase